ncbi:mCG140729 [Mus musculus]|nr:mCG140729 [Mus musculus]
MTKETWGGKGLFGLHFHITVHHQRKSEQELKQGRDLETGADAEAMEQCRFLTCSCGLIACFLIESRSTRPEMPPLTIDWALPPSITCKETALLLDPMEASS